MKQVKCEMCGSTDMIKENGVFVCQSCGMKYSVEEAKKLMIDGVVEVKGTVQVDSSSEIDNWYVLASREKTWADKIDYYRRIVEKDANSAPACLCVALDKYLLLKKYVWTDSHFYINYFNRFLSRIPQLHIHIDAFSESQIMDVVEAVAQMFIKAEPEISFDGFRESLDALCDEYKVLYNLLMYWSGSKQVVGSNDYDISILHDENISNLIIRKLHIYIDFGLRRVFHSVYYDSYFFSDDYIKSRYELYLEDAEKADAPKEERKDFEEYKNDFELSKQLHFLDELRIVYNEINKPVINPLSDSEKIEEINKLFDSSLENQRRFSLKLENLRTWDLDLLKVAQRIDPNYTHPFIEKLKQAKQARQQAEQARQQAEQARQQAEQARQQEEKRQRKAHVKRIKIYQNVIRFIVIADICVFFVRLFIMHIPIASHGFIFYLGQIFVLMMCGYYYYLNPLIK